MPIKTKAIYEVIDSRCTDNLKMELRSLAAPITYKVTKVIDNNKVTYNVDLYNISETIYALDSSTNKKYTMNNSKITNVEPGTFLNIQLYANEKNYCNGYKIKTITIQIPYYNKYSTNELCKNYKDYILCSENISLNITLEEFELRMKNYISSLNKKEETTNKEEEIIKQDTKLTLFDFIIKYNKYISGFGAILLVIYITVIINNMNKKRGIL